MSIWSKDYIKCRECTFGRKCKDLKGNMIYRCSKNGLKSYGCEFGSKSSDTEYLFKNYKRKVTYV